MLYEELGQVIAAVMTHPTQSDRAADPDVSQISDDVDADTMLGNVVMHLLLETEATEPEIVAIALSPIQWEVFASQVYGYLPPPSSSVPEQYDLLEVSIAQLQTSRAMQDAGGRWQLTEEES
ncbi:MAG: hypothetical protein HC895_27190 [Leptolyngbyaceae cyanobacterium SM1_3_5]|nr:hypothetical protein [Leptolyngbyaceae cyanobacterium SM1_3_5]